MVDEPSNDKERDTPLTLSGLSQPSRAAVDVLNRLESYVRHNAVLPSDHEGSGRVVPLSRLRGWIQRERQSDRRDGYIQRVRESTARIADRIAAADVGASSVPSSEPPSAGLVELIARCGEPLASHLGAPGIGQKLAAEFKRRGGCKAIFYGRTCLQRGLLPGDACTWCLLYMAHALLASSSGDALKESKS